MEDFTVGFMLAVFLGIAGFVLTDVGDNVPYKNFERAIEVCEPNEGLDRVYRASYGDGSFEVLCNNGNLITLQKNYKVE